MSWENKYKYKLIFRNKFGKMSDKTNWALKTLFLVLIFIIMVQQDYLYEWVSESKKLITLETVFMHAYGVDKTVSI